MLRPMDDRLRGPLFGLGSALLFGVGAPIAKLLLPGSGPLALAGLLYLGAGAAFLLVPRSRSEAPLRRADLPALAGAVVSGAGLAPPLMLWGLMRVGGLEGSLLLNLEAPFTMLLAVIFFGEHLSTRETLAAALAIAGGALVGVRNDAGPSGSMAGAAAIALACACWAVDNNLTARISLKDPLQVLRIKSLSAGAANLSLGLALGERTPFAPWALLLGSVSYGASLLLYLRALRVLGAARQAALFAVAPFAGAALAVPLLHEAPRPLDIIGALLMATGVALLIRARHSHRHTHEPIEHEHEHVHDEHHRHAHDGAVAEPHSHPHQHEAIAHEHTHASDAHHKHRH
jgi:drug/metabolite transporter (DMT)-like permease